MRRPVLLAACAACFASPAAAQPEPSGAGPWLPGVRWFPDAVADPLTPRFAGVLVVTDVFAGAASPRERPPFPAGDPAAARREVQGDVVLGGTLPIWQPARWAGGGIVAGFQVAAWGRFRFEFQGNDVVNAQGLLAVPVEVAKGRWSGRLRWLHWSAHLGDQLIEEAGVRRVDYSMEALELAGALAPAPGVRAYAGGALLTRSALRRDSLPGRLDFDDRAEAFAGLEWATPFAPDASDAAGFVAAADVRLAERTGWRARTSVVAGLAARVSGHDLQVRARLDRGPSAMGQWFLTEETVLGLELAWGGRAR